MIERAILAWALLLASCAVDARVRGEQDAHESHVAAAVSRAWAEHIEAARTKDRATVLAIYADDVVYEVRSSDGTPGAGELRGLGALSAMELASLEQADVEAGVVHTTHALRVFADAAYELGTVAGPVRPRGQGVREVTFHFMALWERGADGSWRIRQLVGRM